MRAARPLALCLITWLSACTALRPARHFGTEVRAGDGHALFACRMQQALGLFRAGRYQESLDKYQSIRQAAEGQGYPDMVARATANIGGCQFALHQYQSALRTIQEARQIALAVGDTGVAAAFEANIASLYAELGNLDAAASWMKESLARISGRDRADQLARMQIQMATLLARQKKTEAWGYFCEGIDGADRANDSELSAIAWNRIGEEYLKQADPQDEGANLGQDERGRLLDGAERALLEAYRLRKLHHLPLDSSYRNLGRLRLVQGDLGAAAVLLDQAVELAAHPKGLMPTWDIYHQRGLVRLRQGRLAEALDDLRIALKLGRAWRWSAPRDQTAQIGTEGWLSKVYSALIEAGNRLYLQTGDAAMARETFEAAEENRAGSLRALASRANPETLPSGFWEALGDLQRAEVQALRAGAGAGESLESAHARLVSLETSLGPAWRPLPAGLLDRTRRALDPETAWFSFHLGDTDSWLWALDRDGLAVYRLPARKTIKAQVSEAAAAIRDDLPSAEAAGAALYATLFGGLAERFRTRSRWLLALDQDLFDAPLAALREGPGGRYVVERHITEVEPGAGYWLEASARRRALASSNLFVGIGDPIYNTADSRLAQTARVRQATIFSIFEPAARANDRPAGLMLPRLVASAAELEDCARAWKGSRILLEGKDVSRSKVIAQWEREPAVLHFATHFLGLRDKDAVIALGLTAAREIELLTPEEIAHRTVPTGLVVLSGCHSAAGAALPGTGLLGLTRAFLAAGAGAVVSSRWATPDDEGALFHAFYSNLGQRRSEVGPQGPEAGRALRAAQLEMIHAGGPRARPPYWSAYFLVGNL